MSPSPRRVVFVALFALGCIASHAFAGPIHVYNPGLGTLPQAQGWTLAQDPVNGPAPTVAGGVLHQFEQPVNGVQSWSRSTVPLDFMTNSYVYEADLSIVSSNYSPNGGGPGSQRSGYYLWVADGAGRFVALGIGGNGITINTNGNFSPTNGVPFTPFASTGTGYHLYRLEINSGGVSLFIDGSFFASTSLGGVGLGGPANAVVFGDVTLFGRSETDLRSLTFGIPMTTAIPEPSTLTMFGCGAVALFAIRRRVRR